MITSSASSSVYALLKFAIPLGVYFIRRATFRNVANLGDKSRWFPNSYETFGVKKVKRIDKKYYTLYLFQPRPMLHA